MTLRSSVYDRELSHKQSNMTMAAPESCEDEEDGDDDQMDRMSVRLRGLIEQGQQALRKEVVVTDESVIDEYQGVEDDGSHDWEDDERITPATLRRPRSNASLPVLSRSVSQRDLHAPYSITLQTSSISCLAHQDGAASPPFRVVRWADTDCSRPHLAATNRTAHLMCSTCACIDASIIRHPISQPSAFSTGFVAAPSGYIHVPYFE